MNFHNAPKIGIFFLAFCCACSTERGARSSPNRTRMLVRPVVVKGTILRSKTFEPVPQLELRDTPKLRKFFFHYRDRNRQFIEDALLRYGDHAPVILSALERWALPAELINVAIVESRLNPKAKSPMGASGLWQMMTTTARLYGLRVSLFKDERKDPELSTEAAVQYLSDLYGRFGDWLLALAAYNAGPSRVSNALKQCEKPDFFELDRRKLLPEETSDFVHRVMAITLIMRRPESYGFIKPDLGQQISNE